MTDNEKLARWQGWKRGYGIKVVSPNGIVFTSLPDYLNDDAAAMSLLDTLVEKGYEVRLEDHCDFTQKGWGFTIFDSENDGENSVEIDCKPTRREAVVAACLELIEKEWVDD